VDATKSGKTQKQFFAFIVAAAVLSGLIGFGLGSSSGYASGKTDGYNDGFDKGSRDAWGRAVEAATLKAYWAGAFDACNMVFDATGWEYIYVNIQAGGGTISREYFCRDNGDYSGTPVFDIPFVPAELESN